MMNADLRDLIDQLQSKVEHVFKDVLDKDTIMPNEDVSPRVSNMIRVQRSLSWLQRAADLGDNHDPDITFILSWIAFESLYGDKKNIVDDSTSVSVKITKYLNELEKTKNDRMRMQTALTEVLDEINNLFANPYISKSAWGIYYDHHARTGKNSNPFKINQRKVKKSDLEQIEKMNKILKELFERLYLLRNQLFHGNATLKGIEKEDRSSQINDGARVVQEMVPLFIWIMLDHMEQYPDSDKWGLIPYPRIKLGSK